MKQILLAVALIAVPVGTDRGGGSIFLGTIVVIVMYMTLTYNGEAVAL